MVGYKMGDAGPYGRRLSPGMPTFYGTGAAESSTSPLISAALCRARALINEAMADQSRVGSGAVAQRGSSFPPRPSIGERQPRYRPHGECHQAPLWTFNILPR